MRGLLPRIAVLEREAADVVRPVGNARHRNVDPRRNLLTKVVPARGDVAGPERRTAALDACIARSGEDEGPDVGLELENAFVDAAGVDERVAVEEELGRSLRGRAHHRLALLDRQVRVHVGLGRVHPPGVDAKRREPLAHLAPVYVAPLFRIRIVEAVEIARPNPVLVPRLDIALVDVTRRLELLVGVRRRVELGPDRDHEARVHAVHFVDHALWVREAPGIEAMAAPVVLSPVEPVLHDVVERDAEAAILADDAHQLVLRVVALPALPEAIGPFGHHRRLAGERPVAGDDAIHRVRGDDIIVDRAARLGRHPQRIAVGRRKRVVVEERDIAGVRLPFDPDVDGLARGHRQIEVMIPGVPVLPPAVENQLPVRVELEIARCVELELVKAALLRRQRGAPDDAFLPRRVARRVLPAGGGDRGGLGLGGVVLLVADILVVDLRLVAREDEPVAQIILRGEARAAVGPDHLELVLAHEAVWLRIAEAGDRVIVPQQPIVPRRDDERHRDVHIVLGEFHVLAQIVHHPLLVLAEAVESFGGPAVELLADAEQLLAPCGHLPELRRARLLDERPARGVFHRDEAVGEAYFGRAPARPQRHPVAALVDGELAARLGHHHQAVGKIDLRARYGRHAEQAVAIDEHAHALGRTAIGRDDDAVLAAFDLSRLRRPQRRATRRKQRQNRQNATPRRPHHQSFSPASPTVVTALPR